MIVLDTNVVSEMFRVEPDVRVVEWLESLEGEVAITAITLAELLAGVRRLPPGRRRSQLETAVTDAVEPYRDSGAVLPFDDSCAAAYAEVLVERERAGRAIGTADAQIAAICRTHDAVCATRNTKDFVDAGVTLVNPWDHARPSRGVVTLTGRLICADADEAAVVRRHLDDHVVLTRAEPGCLSFHVETTTDPLVWSVAERFADQQAFDAHQARVAASDWGRATVGIERDYVVRVA